VPTLFYHSIGGAAMISAGDSPRGHASLRDALPTLRNRRQPRSLRFLAAIFTAAITSG
jgi:hypothetical protein